MNIPIFLLFTFLYLSYVNPTKIIAGQTKAEWLKTCKRKTDKSSQRNFVDSFRIHGYCEGVTCKKIGKRYKMYPQFCPYVKKQNLKCTESFSHFPNCCEELLCTLDEVDALNTTVNSVSVITDSMESETTDSTTEMSTVSTITITTESTTEASTLTSKVTTTMPIMANKAATITKGTTESMENEGVAKDNENQFVTQNQIVGEPQIIPKQTTLIIQTSVEPIESMTTEARTLTPKITTTMPTMGNKAATIAKGTTESIENESVAKDNENQFITQNQIVGETEIVPKQTTLIIPTSVKTVTQPQNPTPSTHNTKTPIPFTLNPLLPTTFNEQMATAQFIQESSEVTPFSDIIKNKTSPPDIQAICEQDLRQCLELFLHYVAGDNNDHNKGHKKKIFVIGYVSSRRKQKQHPKVFYQAHKIHLNRMKKLRKENPQKRKSMKLTEENIIHCIIYLKACVNMYLEFLGQPNMNRRVVHGKKYPAEIVQQTLEEFNEINPETLGKNLHEPKRMSKHRNKSAKFKKRSKKWNLTQRARKICRKHFIKCLSLFLSFIVDDGYRKSSNNDNQDSEESFETNRVYNFKDNRGVGSRRQVTDDDVTETKVIGARGLQWEDLYNEKVFRDLQAKHKINGRRLSSNEMYSERDDTTFFDNDLREPFSQPPSNDARRKFKRQKELDEPREFDAVEYNFK